jgi:hypothetical protein
MALVEVLRDLESYLEENCPVAPLLREISTLIVDLEIGGVAYAKHKDGTIKPPRPGPKAELGTALKI